MSDLEKVELAIRTVLSSLSGTETAKEALAQVAEEIQFMNEYGSEFYKERLQELRDGK